MKDKKEEFMTIAIEEALKSKSECDGRIHPKVGVLVVKEDEILAKAHRGELEFGDHAEYTVLEKKLKDILITGATVYTTLEPCTKRNIPKIPCVERLIERKVHKVVIGILDPNPSISGKGQMKLREANIETEFFTSRFASQIEELNREFIRYQKNKNEILKLEESNVNNLISASLQMDCTNCGELLSGLARNCRKCSKKFCEKCLKKCCKCPKKFCEKCFGGSDYITCPECRNEY